MMLILGRKQGEEIVIECNGRIISITVVENRSDRVRIGFTADKDVGIYRSEIYDAITKERRELNALPTDTNLEVQGTTNGS